MSEQKLNSIPNAEVNSVSHACHKPMLGAGASLSDGVSNEDILSLSAPIDCPPNEYEECSISDKARQMSKEFGVEGAIIILQKPNDSGQLIGVSNLNHAQIRECLSIATYYNEKAEID